MSPLTPEQFEGACNALKDAKRNLHRLVKVQGDAKKALETKKIALQKEGVEGSNKEQRDATLKDAVKDEQAALEEAEQNTADARLEFECAQLDWDNLRYQKDILRWVKA